MFVCYPLGVGCGVNGRLIKSQTVFCKVTYILAAAIVSMHPVLQLNVTEVNSAEMQSHGDGSLKSHE